MADEKKKMNGGLIAAICVLVVAAIAAIVAVVVINVTKPNIVGKYNITAILDSEGNESEDSMKFLKAFGADYKIEFRDDKTGTLYIKMDPEMISSFVSSFTNPATGESAEVSGSDIENSGLDNTSINFTYDDNKIKANSGTAGNLEMDYEFKDGAVILSFSGQRLKFTKE